jgi:hypothetical protein
VLARASSNLTVSEQAENYCTGFLYLSYPITIGTERNVSETESLSIFRIQQFKFPKIGVNTASIPAL